MPKFLKIDKQVYKPNENKSSFCHKLIRVFVFGYCVWHVVRYYDYFDQEWYTIYSGLPHKDIYIR